LLLEIANQAKRYAWGSLEDIPRFQGRLPGEYPEAELWLGAHPVSPSRIVGSENVNEPLSLDGFIARRPEFALGADRSSDDLPFLVKLLSARKPLSIQVHPDATQAREGFAAESLLGIPVDSSHRTYRDPRAKPEMVLPLSGRVDALLGFRHPVWTVRLLDYLLEESGNSPTTRKALNFLRSRLAGLKMSALRSVVVDLTDPELPMYVYDGLVSALSNVVPGGSWAKQVRSLAWVAQLFPGDAGLLVALLMNHVTLHAGQAAFVGPGLAHAYLHGFALEVMGASDNVVRCGLTEKMVGREEFLRVTDFQASASIVRQATECARGVSSFCHPEFQFTISILTSRGGCASSVELNGPAIAVGLEGSPLLRGRLSERPLTRGRALFVTPDESAIHSSGCGTLALVAASSIGD